jgi:hypothetical protein
MRSDRIAEQYVLGAQVAVSIDDTALATKRLRTCAGTKRDWPSISLEVESRYLLRAT